MVAAAARLRAARGDAAFGILTGTPRVDLAALVARRQAVTEQLRGGVGHLLGGAQGRGRRRPGHLIDARTCV